MEFVYSSLIVMIALMALGIWGIRQKRKQEKQ